MRIGDSLRRVDDREQLVQGEVGGLGAPSFEADGCGPGRIAGNLDPDQCAASGSGFRVAADHQVRSYPLDLRIEGVQPGDANPGVRTETLESARYGLSVRSVLVLENHHDPGPRVVSHEISFCFDHARRSDGRRSGGTGLREGHGSATSSVPRPNQGGCRALYHLVLLTFTSPRAHHAPRSVGAGEGIGPLPDNL